ncbi:MAG: hypothetical protein HQL69_06390 [Magnetococcales bacterium]|nr:hypothetical protein [Magnetococcales bacterium]
MNVTKRPKHKTKYRLTRHTLDVESPKGRHLSHEDCHSITELPGVDTVVCDMDKGHLELTYNLKQLRLHHIEEHLLKLGYIRKMDFFHQVRNDLAHFFEDNEVRGIK